MIFSILREGDLRLIGEALKGKRVGLTSGSFDMFHDMHRVYLERCRYLCDELIVGVDSNDLVRRRKGSDRPKISENQRVALVSSQYTVTAAFVLGEVEHFGLAVDRLKVKTIFKNDNFTREEIIGGDLAEVIIIPDIAHFSSTTELIESILRGKSEEKS